MFEKMVNDWIKNNFNENEIEIENFDLVTAGKLITDKEGKQMLVWVDIISYRICYAFQNEDKIHHGAKINNN